METRAIVVAAPRPAAAAVFRRRGHVWRSCRLVGTLGRRHPGSLFNFSLFQRCLIAGHAVCFYLGKLFCPVGLPFFHSRWDFSLRSPMAWWNAQPDLIFFYPAGTWASTPGCNAFTRRRPSAYWSCFGSCGGVGGTAGGLFVLRRDAFSLLGFSNAVLFKYTFVATISSTSPAWA